MKLLFPQFFSSLFKGFSPKQVVQEAKPQVPSTEDLAQRISRISDEGSIKDAEVTYTLITDWQEYGGEEQFVSNFASALVTMSNALSAEDTISRTSCVTLSYYVVDDRYKDALLSKLASFRKNAPAIELCCQRLEV